MCPKVLHVSIIYLHERWKMATFYKVNLPPSREGSKGFGAPHELSGQQQVTEKLQGLEFTVGSP